MAQVIADRRDVDFVLHEQLNVGALSEHDRFAEFNKKTIDLIVNEARNLAVKEILPTFKEGDEQGCRFENGQVFVPESFKRAYALFVEGEWLAMPEDPEYGGQGMPRTVALAAGDYFNGANYAFMMYPGPPGGGFRHGAPEAAVPEKHVHRPMDRHHAAHRTRGRQRRGEPVDHGGEERRRHLFDHRQQDIHLLGRA